jgi:HlyD family secretion protein
VASVAKAKADVENAAAQISGFQTQLNKAQVRSPIDGVVLERRVSTGQTVAASFQTPVLFTLASDLSTMQLAVDIDEADIGLVREGQTAHFTVDAYPQRQFDARLISVRNLPKSANGVVTYQGLLAVDNSAKLLRPGLTATASILVSETKGDADSKWRTALYACRTKRIRPALAATRQWRGGGPRLGTRRQTNPYRAI